MLDVGRCPLCPDPSIRGRALTQIFVVELHWLVIPHLVQSWLEHSYAGRCYHFFRQRIPWFHNSGCKTVSSGLHSLVSSEEWTNFETSSDTGTQWTDGQTDGRTDIFAISISRVSMLTRDKNQPHSLVVTVSQTSWKSVWLVTGSNWTCYIVVKVFVDISIACLQLAFQLPT